MVRFEPSSFKLRRAHSDGETELWLAVQSRDVWLEKFTGAPADSKPLRDEIGAMTV
jgi:hypothetical protein